MPRVLRVTERSVPAPARTRYHRALVSVRDAVEARGGHFWVFTRHDDPGLHLEFTEGRDQGFVGANEPADAAVDAIAPRRTESWWDAFSLDGEE